MRRILTDLFSVLFSFFRFLLIKIFHLRGFKFRLIERFSPNVVVEIAPGGRMELGKRVAPIRDAFSRREKARN